MTPPKQRDERLAGLLSERYQVTELLGEGGFARVYRVMNLRLRRVEALKVLSQELTEDSEFAQRFEQEAHVSGSLDHPNIVKIYDSGVTDGIAWFSMQFIEGQTLGAQLRASTEKMDEAAAARIAVPVLDALEYSHSHGVVHRDIKPDNIMMDARGRPYLTDFGIAKAQDSLVKTRAGFLMGSPAYMAPEQIRGQSIDGRTDLYALAVTIYRLLTGGFPFVADDTLAAAMKKLGEAPEPLSKGRPDINPEFEAIVMKALAREPAERYATAQEMREALESYFDVFRLSEREREPSSPRRTVFPWDRTPAGSTPRRSASAAKDPTPGGRDLGGEPAPPTSKLEIPSITVLTPVRRPSMDAEASSMGRASPPASVAGAGKQQAVQAPSSLPAQAPARSQASAWRSRIPLAIFLLALASLVWIALRLTRDSPSPEPSVTTRRMTPATVQASSGASVSVPSPAAPLPLPTSAPSPPAEPTRPSVSVAKGVKPTAEQPVREARRSRPAPMSAAEAPQMGSPGSSLPPTSDIRYCAGFERTAYTQGAAAELPSGFAKDQGVVFRGPRTDSARIQIEIVVRPPEPKEGESFEVAARLSNGGDSDLIVSRVDESSPREAEGFRAVSGPPLPATVSAGGVLSIYRSTTALHGGGTYRKELRITDSFKDAWRASVVVKPCPSP